MYTVIWTDDYGEDHFARLDSSEQVSSYIQDNFLTDNEDVEIFYPEADYYKCDVNDWMKDHVG